MSRTSKKIDYQHRYVELSRKVDDRMFLLHCHPEALEMVIKELLYGYTLEFDQYGHPIGATPPE